MCLEDLIRLDDPEADEPNKMMDQSTDDEEIQPAPWTSISPQPSASTNEGGKLRGIKISFDDDDSNSSDMDMNMSLDWNRFL